MARNNFPCLKNSMEKDVKFFQKIIFRGGFVIGSEK